jgi:hypothetical protein
MQTKAVFQELRLLSARGMVGAHIRTGGQYPQIRNLVRPLEFPLLFNRWDRLLQSQQNRANWNGSRLVSLHKRLFYDYVNFRGEFVFTGIGVVFLLRKKRPALPPEDDRSRMIPLLYFVINYVFILLFMNLNWDRYYLPTVIACKLIAAAGLYAFITYAYRTLSEFRPGTLLRWRTNSTD